MRSGCVWKDVPGIGQDTNADDVEEDAVSVSHTSGTQRRKHR